MGGSSTLATLPHHEIPQEDGDGSSSTVVVARGTAFCRLGAIGGRQGREVRSRRRGCAQRSSQKNTGPRTGERRRQQGPSTLALCRPRSRDAVVSSQRDSRCGDMNGVWRAMGARLGPSEDTPRHDTEKARASLRSLAGRRYVVSERWRRECVQARKLRGRGLEIRCRF